MQLADGLIEITMAGRNLTRSITEIHRINDRDIYSKKDKTNAIDMIQSAALRRLELSQSLRTSKPYGKTEMMKESCFKLG